MPVDLYQWEEGGGLVHHCPKCFKPLTTPQARSRCLGHHVEWCPRYHTQLFKKGTSNQCNPCRQSDEQRSKRHREIAELIQKLENLDSNTPSTPLTTRNLNTLSATPEEHSSMTKKERKAAKKAKKVAGMPKVVNAATIEHIGKILYPHECDDDEAELESQLLDDADISLNRFFHKGTSNVRESRKTFIMRDRKGGKGAEFHVDAEEMKGLLQLLNVSPITSSSSSDAKKTMKQLREKIEADMLQAHEEMAGTMMRKAGFWRWASKKAYDRLVANGRIWSQRDFESVGTRSKSSDNGFDGSTEVSGTAHHSTDGTEMTEPDMEASAFTAEEPQGAGYLIDTLPKTPKTPMATITPIADDSWTSVTKSKSKAKSKKSPPPIKIKMSSNGGLAKMVQSSTPKSARTLGFLGQDD